MIRHHWPNPLDLLFFAIDENWRSRGLPGVDIHLVLELRGQIDVAALQQAHAALRRRYPACAATLAQPRGRPPHWRLDRPAIESGVEILHSSAETAPLAASGLEQILAQRLGRRCDYKRVAPFQITLLRGGDGDKLLARWPHALMDARGGVTLLEELARLAREQRTAELVTTSGDERRRDFGALDDQFNVARNLSLMRAHAPSARGGGEQVIRLCDQAGDGPLGQQRVLVRRFAPPEFASVRAAALAICGYARFADYVRICALMALAEIAGAGAPPGSIVTAFNLIDNRRRRDPGPVCHNVFSTMPLRIQLDVARDKRRCAAEMERQTHAMRAGDEMTRRLTGLKLLTLLPTGLLAWLMGQPWAPIGPQRAPSLPLGFMGPPGDGLEDFCGARVVNIFGTRPAAPEAGFSMNVNVAYDRLNICAAHWTGRIAPQRFDAFVDRFVALLTRP